jgi:hypothetical protein
MPERLKYVPHNRSQNLGKSSNLVVGAISSIAVYHVLQRLGAVYNVMEQPAVAHEQTFVITTPVFRYSLFYND